MSDELPVPTVNDNTIVPIDMSVPAHMDDDITTIVDDCVQLADNIVKQRNTQDTDAAKLLGETIQTQKFQVADMIAKIVYETVDDAMDEYLVRNERKLRKIKKIYNKLKRRLKAIA